MQDAKWADSLLYTISHQFNLSVMIDIIETILLVHKPFLDHLGTFPLLNQTFFHLFVFMSLNNPLIINILLRMTRGCHLPLWPNQPMFANRTLEVQFNTVHLPSHHLFPHFLHIPYPQPIQEECITLNDGPIYLEIRDTHHTGMKCITNGMIEIIIATRMSVICMIGCWNAMAIVWRVKGWNDTEWRIVNVIGLWWKETGKYGEIDTQRCILLVHTHLDQGLQIE
jgi:hypothetical protein